MPSSTLNPDVSVGLGRLSVEDVVRVARDKTRVADLTPDVEERMGPAADWVASTVEQIARARTNGAQPTAYYGINTGFGAQVGRSALDSRYLTEVLGRNLMASHSVGVGAYFDEAVVRAVLLIRAQSLSHGVSGVRPLIPRILIAMLNAGVYPAIPEQGSLGASGDLAPLAHLLLVMCEPPTPEAGGLDLKLDPTDGEAFLQSNQIEQNMEGYKITEDYGSSRQTLWRRVPGAEAMAVVGGKIALRAKEALALMNGSTFSAAIAALVVRDAQNLLDNFELALALALEGIRGFRDPFYPLLHRARGHEHAERVGWRILQYLEGSQLVDAGDLRTDPVRIPPQDPYSVRCAPQVMGTFADVLEMARRWVEMDINGVTDNPLIFMDLERGYKTMSGGNFHGEPISMAMDFLGIALTELGSISERRMFMLTNYHPEQPHGLKEFLVDERNETGGLNSGLMMLQATAAALVSDSKTLASPDSVDSIPSSGNQEDHVSMSLNAARHARDIVRNIENIAALEFLCAAQAVALQLAKPGSAELKLGRGTQAACRAIRAAGILPLTQDRVLYPDIRKALALVRSGALVRAAREAGIEPDA
jgi:histidine ammonia-lyase